MGVFSFFIVGFMVGALIYDLLGDRKVLSAIMKAFVDVRDGFKKQREQIDKDKEGGKNGR